MVDCSAGDSIECQAGVAALTPRPLPLQHSPLQPSCIQLREFHTDFQFNSARRRSLAAALVIFNTSPLFLLPFLLLHQASQRPNTAQNVSEASGSASNSNAMVVIVAALCEKLVHLLGLFVFFVFAH